MKSVFHHLQYKKNRNNMVIYSNTYISDWFSVEPINDENIVFLNKWKENNMIPINACYETLDDNIKILLKKEKIRYYEWWYYYYVSWLPCDLGWYYIIGEWIDQSTPRGKHTRYVNITNWVNIYKLLEY